MLVTSGNSNVNYKEWPGGAKQFEDDELQDLLVENILLSENFHTAQQFTCNKKDAKGGKMATT